jgi:hypothetical protein
VFWVVALVVAAISAVSLREAWAGLRRYAAGVDLSRGRQNRLLRAWRRRTNSIPL